jgi:nucleotide-binding universal stress UspA family protein
MRPGGLVDMIEKVLVATDFSKDAEKIVECTGEIPGIKEVVLLNVVSKDQLEREWSPGDAVAKAKAEIDEPVKKLEGIGLKVKARVESSRDSPEFKVIEGVAKEETVDLVVMGARGKSFLKSIVLGSVSTNVLRYGTHNLLIMRYKLVESGKLESICPDLFSKVLCPVDLSKAGMAAVNLIKDLGLATNVHFLSVIAKGETAEEVEARMKDAEKKLDAIENELLSKMKVNVTTEVVSTKAGYRTYGAGGLALSKGTDLPEVKGVEEIIISKAEEMNASLIALSSEGEGYLDEAETRIGSVVFDVGRKATRPVLVVRAKKA